MHCEAPFKPDKPQIIIPPLVRLKSLEENFPISNPRKWKLMARLGVAIAIPTFYKFSELTG